MTRRETSRSAVALVRALLAGVPLVLGLAGGCGGDSPVPTVRVERRGFEHRVTAEGVLVAGRTTKLTVPTEVARSVRLAWILDEGLRVEEGQVVARFDRRSMEERLADGSIDRAIADRKIDRTTVEKARRVEDLEAAARVAELELEHARDYRRQDEQVFSRREVLDDAIDEELAAERRGHALENASTERDLSATELALLQIERRRAQQTIDEASRGLDALEVRAPHGGILTYVRWRGEGPSVGAEMWRGQQLAEIPDLDSIEAEVYVLEADAGGLEPGQPAEIVVEARPDRVLAGEVARVEPVAQPRFRGSPVQYFGVVVRLEDLPEDGPPLKPGQRVRATLVLDRVADALVVPRQAVVEDEDGPRVWVRGSDGLRPTPVEIGVRGLGLVTLASGVEEGQEIALRAPEDAGPAPRGAAALGGDSAGGAG